jgi:peptidoglycan/xylan/chitin deacetylase (PgdA/CDA1 family)
MAKNILYRSTAASLRWTSHWSGAALRRARSILQPRILMYHVIGDHELSVRQFEWQLNFLRDYFEPVHLGTLVERLQAGSVTGREVAITFDDGVRNHFQVAWPLLQAYGVPATFFVCPGLTESGEWLWRTELRMRLRLMDDSARASAASNAGFTGHAVEPIMDWTKQLPMDARRAFQRDIASRTRDFSPPREQMERHAPLTWEELRQMSPALITIGSHTSSHPMLPTLDESALQDEIAGSRRTLEERLDRSVDLFCYPNGGNSEAVVAMVRQHYRAAVTTRKAAIAETEDLCKLPRIPAAGSRAIFTRRMHKPSA